MFGPLPTVFSGILFFNILTKSDKIRFKDSEKVIWHWFYNPPASKANRKVANLTERKNMHTHVNGVKEFVYLSVHIIPDI